MQDALQSGTSTRATFQIEPQFTLLRYSLCQSNRRQPLAAVLRGKKLLCTGLLLPDVLYAHSQSAYQETVE